MQEDTGFMRTLGYKEVLRERLNGNNDLIFVVGEHVKVKGGDFKISSFGKKMMVLEGLPGTRIRK